MRSVPSRRRLPSTAAATDAALAPAGSFVPSPMPYFVAMITSSRRVAEGLAEQLLAQGSAVDVGGVEEVDAFVQCGIDDRLRGGRVDAASEVVAADADERDGQAADWACLHVVNLLSAS